MYVVVDLGEEAVTAQHRRVAPVQRSLGTRRVQGREAHGVGAETLHELVGVDDVAEVLAHLAPVADHHLVEEAARERLAVGEELERADVAQRLRHEALVEDEVAAVRPRDDALAGKPVAQVREREDLLERLLARLDGDAHGHPQPQRVEVAVERVDLAPSRAIAARARGVHEVRALRERVAAAGGRDVDREHHGKLLLGDRHRAAALAVHDRDRRSPRALARDREVLGLVADGGPRHARNGWGESSVARVRLGRRGQSRGDHLVAVVALGNPEHGGRAEAPVYDRRYEHRQRRAAGGRGERAARVDHRDRLGVARRSLETARAQLLELLPRPLSRGPLVDRGVLWRDQDEARELECVRVGREDGELTAVVAAQVDLDAIDAAEHETLARERVLVPVLLEPREPLVVLGHVCADAQVPLGVLDQLGIAHLADRWAATLSYGDQRRLEVARALAGMPRFLLLDEPAAGMNENESEELRSSIEQIRSELECGILVVEHDLRLIMQLCDTIYVLNEGAVISRGTPEKVRSDPAVIAAYIGEEERDVDRKGSVE